MADAESKYIKTVGDLGVHLREEVAFLQASSAAFDQGFEAEAKRLSTTIRVLIHDTKNQKSLLRQLNVKHKIWMLDTAGKYRPENPMMHQGLVILKVEGSPSGPTQVAVTLVGKPEDFSGVASENTGSATYVARVNGPGDPPDHVNQEVSFSQWWEGIVVKDLAQTTFTRKDLILTMADQRALPMWTRV